MPSAQSSDRLSEPDASAREWPSLTRRAPTRDAWTTHSSCRTVGEGYFMQTSDRPALRCSITPHLDPEDPLFVWLLDGARLTPYSLRLPREMVVLLPYF